MELKKGCSNQGIEILSGFLTSVIIGSQSSDTEIVQKILTPSNHFMHSLSLCLVQYLYRTRIEGESRS